MHAEKIMSTQVRRERFEVDGEPTTSRVQRLTAKPASDFHARLSQAFGGGMYGMSKDAWAMCQSVFDFDYMGAAEYEFGAIPEALGNIVAERADYEAWSFVIKSEEVQPGWWRQDGIGAHRRAETRAAKARNEKPPRMTPKHKKELADRVAAPIPDATIYVVSNKAQGRDVVERLIRRINQDKVYTKNGARFILDPEPGSLLGKIIGWFDLDNEVLWFTDKDVFDAFVATFEIGKTLSNNEAA